MCQDRVYTIGAIQRAAQMTASTSGTPQDPAVVGGTLIVFLSLIKRLSISLHFIHFHVLPFVASSLGVCVRELPMFVGIPKTSRAFHLESW